MDLAILRGQKLGNGLCIGSSHIDPFRAVVDKGEMENDFHVHVSGLSLCYNQICNVYVQVTDLPLSTLCCQQSIFGWKKMS